MNRFFLSILFVLFASVPSVAQQNKIKISYSRNIPLVARQNIPVEGETKFFGVWAEVEKDRKLAVHFYSSPSKEQPLRCKVDLFESNSRKRSTVWRPINSVVLDVDPQRFNDQLPHAAFTYRYGANVVWVDQKRQKLPALKFDVYDKDAVLARSGVHILVALPRGWSSKASIQYFAWSDSINSGSEFRFDKTDERGFMVITQFNARYGGDFPDQVSQTDYKWDGEQFAVNDRIK